MYRESHFHLCNFPAEICSPEISRWSVEWRAKQYSFWHIRPGLRVPDPQTTLFLTERHRRVSAMQRQREGSSQPHPANRKIGVYGDWDWFVYSPCLPFSPQIPPRQSAWPGPTTCKRGQPFPSPARRWNLIHLLRCCGSFRVRRSRWARLRLRGRPGPRVASRAGRGGRGGGRTKV